MLKYAYYTPGPGVTNFLAIDGRSEFGNFDPLLKLNRFETKD